MKAITIHPVWAWAIIHGHKRVENRTWRAHHRGKLLIHASSDSPAARQSDTAARVALSALGVLVPQDVPHAALVGIVELVEVFRYAPGQNLAIRFVREMLPNLVYPPEIDPTELESDPLATGPFCWVLRHPLFFRPPIPYRGQQGLFEVRGVRLPIPR